MKLAENLQNFNEDENGLIVNMSNCMFNPECTSCI